MINVAEAATSPGEVTEAGGEDGEVLVRVYSEDSAYVDTSTAPPDNRYTVHCHWPRRSPPAQISTAKQLHSTLAITTCIMSPSC